MAEKHMTEVKTVSIVGVGALGILYGQELARHMPKGTVRFIADRSRCDRYRAGGIFCNGERTDFDFILPGGDIPPADLLIFAVKSPDLGQAIAEARSQVGEETTILSLLNGIHSEQALADSFGPEKVLCCVAQGMDATKIGNELQFTRTGVLEIGTADGAPNERLRTVTAFFDRVGRAYHVYDDMPRRIWSKFMLNCGVNQAAMVYDIPYGGLQQDGAPRSAMLAAMDEVLRIAGKAGLDLNGDDIAAWMVILDSLSANGRPSMAQDRVNRRRSEVDFFAGTVSELGQKYGVPTPVNDRFAAEIHRIEAAYPIDPK
jgi:2-dehydropantoate 2-reductase